MLDETGPYDFVVDTGAQITTIDPKLAAELHPKRLGATHLTGVGTYSRAEYAQVALIQAGAYSVKDPLVLVQDLGQLQQADPRIRRILGENFLEHFDLLIDYEHRILCLDETKEMQQKVKGERIALTPPPHADEYRPFTLPVIVAIRVSGISDRPWLLQLDSGIDVAVLFECGKRLPHLQAFGATRGHGDPEEVTQAFAVLMPQDVKVGGHWFGQISFVTPVASGREIPVKPDVDGVLPTILFGAHSSATRIASPLLSREVGGVGPPSGVGSGTQSACCSAELPHTDRVRRSRSSIPSGPDGFVVYLRVRRVGSREVQE